MKFKSINPKDIKENVFRLIGDDWMLISAKRGDKFNMMTASWGGMGVLWRKNTATAYVRPQRHTRGFIDSAKYFTLSFFDEAFRPQLTVCGKESGRDVDKTQKTGLHPIMGADNTVYFEEARLVLVCKKLYTHDFAPENFLSEDIAANYEDDYHRMYIGEITEVLEKME